VEQFPTKSAATKACELLRANINREARLPRTFGELADHYIKRELPSKSPYHGEVQVVTPAKREAQSRIVKLLPFPNVPTRLTGAAVTA
jgi:hypothetical protein